MRPCGHFMICRNCTQELMSRSQPCPICRKPISIFEVGVYSNSTGEPGLWPMSHKHFGQLASGEGFNEYFRKQFNSNEEPYLEWKEVFDVLEIVRGMRCHHNVRVHLKTQVLSIMRSEDLLAMLEEKKVRGEKKKQKMKNDPRKLEILDACFALGMACGMVGGVNDARRYILRAKEGYETLLGRDHVTTIQAQIQVIRISCTSDEELLEKTKMMHKRCEKVLGEEHFTTLSLLKSLANEYSISGELEESWRLYERHLAYSEKVEDQASIVETCSYLGSVHRRLGKWDKFIEYYERCLV
ncbi:hypothetical protein TrLO_g14422 [Triparma laevis f. longispina]|uniref:RING-type domain-containing protein n=1 Tax=Triparma laevis f. longispina TaxID=1714387 RepID=A0A9W7F578_9STRA|nr:hypothetical protein TrLO_g14422 [Triparma laevis f. longispina]